ncbi:MBL fold metallo-hydrolase [Streptacidiphilus sp. PB12-B1b]|uniref:MBL fold metallo-hydrolase n=1 Tax=Streptacidiphilus sp. PB12-B1b TaxID=2705012 RepID=UPI0015FAFF54|nr:MBL fold metallo-hydrolase [Streptacidiphilus sp. PB12-B1b]QMU75811.1 MBL fold metallo-hydrolase [Streptacidiphilus sp. PB12-B1b]
MNDPAVGGWREVADRVFQRRYQPFDVTVSVVAGADGLAVVDTRSSLAEARELREDLRRLSPAPVRWVVNTHVHFDHVWGNAEFAAPRQEPPAQFWAHAAAVAAMTRAVQGRDPEASAFKVRLAAKSPRWAANMAELEEVVPDHAVGGGGRADRHTLELGDRAVHLLHLGRGHTDGDLVLHIPDADALLAGDLVEQSGPPAFGPDSYPLDWAPTLDALIATAVGPDTVVVPGHGEAVGRAFVRAQRDAIRSVAERCAVLHAAGVPVGEARAAGGDWAYQPDQLDNAVERAYAQLDGAID